MCDNKDSRFDGGRKGRGKEEDASGRVRELPPERVVDLNELIETEIRRKDAIHRRGIEKWLLVFWLGGLGLLLTVGLLLGDLEAAKTWAASVGPVATYAFGSRSAEAFTSQGRPPPGM